VLIKLHKAKHRKNEEGVEENNKNWMKVLNKHKTRN
jgi:hypothetical protein